MKEEPKDQGLFVYASDSYLHANLITKVTLASAEKRRKDFKVDEILKLRVLSFSEERQFDWLNPTRNLEFAEKEVDKYYPQYYHKMDKVRPSSMILAR